MGKNRNFGKIKFLPYHERIGDIAVSNFWMDGDTPKSLQYHTDIPPFSYYAIFKYQPNEYYGKLKEYLDDGWNIEGGGTTVRRDNISIALSFFIGSPENRYTLASWVNMNHDELIPELEFVGSRPFELVEDEVNTFWTLAKMGQEHIEKILRDYEEECNNIL
jgi:hypothetical protein